MIEQIEQFVTDYWVAFWMLLVIVEMGRALLSLLALRAQQEHKGELEKERKRADDRAEDASNYRSEMKEWSKTAVAAQTEIARLQNVIEYKAAITGEATRIARDRALFELLDKLSLIDFGDGPINYRAVNSQVVDMCSQECIPTSAADLLERAEKAEDVLVGVRNLLAVMHSDGGHHTEVVGIVQSCKDAERVRHALLTEIADLREKADTGRPQSILDVNKAFGHEASHAVYQAKIETLELIRREVEASWHRDASDHSMTEMRTLFRRCVTRAIDSLKPVAVLWKKDMCCAKCKCYVVAKGECTAYLGDSKMDPEAICATFKPKLVTSNTETPNRRAIIKMLERLRDVVLRPKHTGPPTGNCHIGNEFFKVIQTLVAPGEWRWAKSNPDARHKDLRRKCWEPGRAVHQSGDNWYDRELQRECARVGYGVPLWVPSQEDMEATDWEVAPQDADKQP